MSKTFITTTYFPTFPDDGDVLSTIRPLVMPKDRPACLVPYEAPSAPPALDLYPETVRQGEPVFLTEAEAEEILSGVIPARLLALTA